MLEPLPRQKSPRGESLLETIGQTPSVTARQWTGTARNTANYIRMKYLRGYEVLCSLFRWNWSAVSTKVFACQSLQMPGLVGIPDLSILLAKHTIRNAFRMQMAIPRALLLWSLKFRLLIPKPSPLSVLVSLIAVFIVLMR